MYNLSKTVLSMMMMMTMKRKKNGKIYFIRVERVVLAGNIINMKMPKCAYHTTHRFVLMMSLETLYNSQIYAIFGDGECDGVSL